MQLKEFEEERTVVASDGKIDSRIQEKQKSEHKKRAHEKTLFVAIKILQNLVSLFRSCFVITNRITDYYLLIQIFVLTYLIVIGSRYQHREKDDEERSITRSYCFSRSIPRHHNISRSYLCSCNVTIQAGND